MKLVTLSQVSEVISGSGFPLDIQGLTNEELPFFKVGDMNTLGNEVLMRIHQHSISRETQKSLGIKVFPKETIIFPKIGAAISTNKKRILVRESCVDNNVMGIICYDKIHSKFLFYLLNSKNLSDFATTSNPPSIRQENIEQWKFFLPSIAEQKRIAAICAKADRLRRTRRYALELSDTYLRSVFLEMFGDPVENPKGWKIIEVSEILSKNRKGTRCGPFGSALKRHEYVDSGIPVWGIDNVNSNQFVETGSLFITSEKYKELENYTVEYEDILISRAGTVGRMCIARPAQYPSIFGTNLICVSLDRNKALPDYFTALFSYFSGRIYNLRASSDEGAYSFINTNVLQSVKILLPPLPLQEKFAAIIQKSNRIRAQQRESLRQAEHLFQTILHRAFRGEL